MISDEGSPLQSIKAPLRTIAVTHDGPNCCVDRIKLTEARRVVVKVSAHQLHGMDSSSISSVCCVVFCTIIAASAQAAPLLAPQVGTQVVSRVSDGRLALGRLGSLIEQIEVLIRSGRQVILVSSGSVGAGKQRMRREQILNSSPLDLQGFNVRSIGLLTSCLPFHSHCFVRNFDEFVQLDRTISSNRLTSPPLRMARLLQNSGASQEAKASVQSRAAAACGQSGIMALYDLLFGHMDLACSQLLISRNDFLNKDFKVGLRQVTTALPSTSFCVPLSSACFGCITAQLLPLIMHCLIIQTGECCSKQTVDHLLNMNVIPVFNENE